MFKNKWRKITFYIWVICIPLALLGGFLRGYNPRIFTVLLTVGIIGAAAGLVILKTLGRKAR